MKKSILFGALAFFAISVMSVQNVQAQDNTKKKPAVTTATAKEQDKPVVTSNEQSKEATPKACEGKKCAEGHKCSAKKAEPKSCCEAEKKAKAEKAVKPEAKKADAKKAEKTEK